MSKPKPLIYWECPGCKFRISETEYRAFRYNLACAGCKTRLFSEFDRVMQERRP